MFYLKTEKNSQLMHVNKQKSKLKKMKSIKLRTEKVTVYCPFYPCIKNVCFFGEVLVSFYLWSNHLLDNVKRPKDNLN